MYFKGISLVNAAKYYEKAIKLSDFNSLNTFFHKHLFHNYLTCLSFLGESKKFETFLNENEVELTRLNPNNLVRLKLMNLIIDNYDTNKIAFMYLSLLS